MALLPPGNHAVNTLLNFLFGEVRVLLSTCYKPASHILFVAPVGLVASSAERINHRHVNNRQISVQQIPRGTQHCASATRTQTDCAANNISRATENGQRRHALVAVLLRFGWSRAAAIRQRNIRIQNPIQQIHYPEVIGRCSVRPSAKAAEPRLRVRVASELPLALHHVLLERHLWGSRRKARREIPRLLCIHLVQRIPNLSLALPVGHALRLVRERIHNLWCTELIHPALLIEVGDQFAR